MATTASPSSSSTTIVINGVPLPVTGNWDQRLVEWIIHPLQPEDTTPSKIAMLQAFQKVDIPPEENNMKNIAEQLVTLGFAQDSTEKKIKVLDAILSATQDAADSSENETIDPEIKQAHILALVFKAQLVGLDLDQPSRGLDLAEQGLKMQQEYNPGKDGRFLFMFYPLLSLFLSMTKNNTFFEKSVEYFHLFADIFLSESGGMYENESERDKAVSDMMVVDTSSIRPSATALKHVCFTYQEHLSLFTSEQIKNMNHAASICIDKMKRCFRKIGVNLDDFVEIIERFGEDSPVGTVVDPVKASIFDTAMCIDSMMGANGEYRKLRVHSCEMTMLIARAAFGYYTEESLLAILSAIYTMFCGGPSILAKPLLNEVKTILTATLGFDFTDIANLNNNNIKLANDEVNWGTQQGSTIASYASGLLTLWKEGDTDAKQTMQSIYASSTIVLETPRALRNMKRPHQMQCRLFRALSGMYLKVEGAQKYFDETIAEGIAFYESGRLLADSDFSFADRSAFCCNLARAWSFREHWTAISLELQSNGQPVLLQNQHAQMMKLIDAAIKFLDDGVAKNENRDDVLSYEDAYAVLADGFERTGTLLLSYTYDALDKASAAALKRGNVFQAALYLRRKALLLKKFDLNNEGAEAEVNRALDLVLNLIVEHEKPNQHRYLIEIALDCLEVLLSFEPKWFANAVVAKASCAIEQLENQIRQIGNTKEKNANDDEEQSEHTKQSIHHIVAILYFGCGAALIRVGVSKKPEGYLKIAKGLHQLLKAAVPNYRDDHLKAVLASDSKFVIPGLERTLEAIGVAKDQLRDQILKWAVPA